MEKILVRGKQYPEGHRNFKPYEDQPNGPLVAIPGTEAALSMGGDGGVRAAGSQQYIGWSTERTEKPILRDGSPHVKPFRTKVGKKMVVQNVPQRYRWVFDPEPRLVDKTAEIIRALQKGEIDEVEMKTGRKGNEGGGS